MSFETRSVDLGEGPTRVLEAGRGDPLLLIHAFPLSADQWGPQLEAPPSGWRLIAPDLRGFSPEPARPFDRLRVVPSRVEGRGAKSPTLRQAQGRPEPRRRASARGGAPGARVSRAGVPELEWGPASAKDADRSAGGSTNLSMDDYAADIEALAAALRLNRVVLAGLSMGGYIIFALLRRRRLDVRGLVLADTRAQADTDEGRAGRRKMMGLAEADGPEAVAREMLPKLVGATTHRERPAVVAKVRQLIVANSSGAIRAALAAMMGRPDSTPLLGSIAAPTLVVVGEEDALTPPANAEELHQGIRGSTLARIPRAGHLSSLERPEAFDAELAAFLRQL